MNGEIRASFARTQARTGLADLYERGGLRLLCPRVARGCEGVIINTGGGVAGGDMARLTFTAGVATEVTLTTQSAEKIYRAEDRAAAIDIALSLAPAASVDWLPQPTILFDGAHLLRRFEVDMVQDASLTAIESYVFGRLAMGETCIHGRLHDRWRIRRDGGLIFAEDFKLDGAISATLDLPACGKGARSAALVVHVASAAEAKLDQVRSRLADANCEGGASAWNGMLVARLVSASPERLRSASIGLLALLRDAPAPRVWQ